MLPPSQTIAPQERQLPEKGIKYYWKNRNIKSIDGLPGMESAYLSEQRPGQFHETGEVYAGLVDDEREKKMEGPASEGIVAEVSREQVGMEKVTLGFGVGVLAGVVLSRWLR